MPVRHRITARTAVTARTRNGPCERNDTPPIVRSMPARPLIAAMARVAAISQSRIEFRLREDSMNRRQFVFSSTAALAGAVLSRNVSAQAPAQPAAPPVTRFEELRRGVGMFIGRGGTIGYLVNGDGAIAVDSQFMDTAEICVAGLKQRDRKS